MEKNAVTIKDIAKKANCSLSTVSKLLNGGNVKEPQRSNIQKIIEELDYHPNVIARGLRNKKSYTIGVVLPYFNSFFSMNIMKIIETELSLKNYTVVLCSSENSPEQEAKKISFLLSNQVDGIILIPVSKGNDSIKELLESNIPFVQVDGIIGGVCAPGVILNNEEVCFETVTNLLQETDKIALIGSTDNYTGEKRLEGYKKAYREKNIELIEDFYQNGNNTIDGGYAAMKNLWKKDIKPRALFVTNYEMTIGAIMAINELGISIPNDLKVVGFDYIGLAKALNLNLTIIEQPLEEIGKKACEVLLSMINYQEKDNNTYVLNAKKVILKEIN